MKYNSKNSFSGFIFPCLIFLALGMFLNIAFSQKDIYFLVNSHNAYILDIMMPYITDIGNGFFCVFICIILLFFINIRFGLAMGASYALEGIFVQVLKQIVFTDRPRPWAAYVDKFAVHLVPDFTPYSNNSFPSGHTATAFCMATIIVLVYPKLNKLWQLSFFIIALAVAYSRIYLSQHYFLDIYVGAVVGILSSSIIYYYFYRHKFKSLKQHLWLDRNLLHLKG